MRVGDERAQVADDRLHDEGGDLPLAQQPLDLVQRVGVERALYLQAAAQQVGQILPVCGGAHAHRAEGVAVVAVLDGHELRAAGGGHGQLEGDLHRLGATGGAVASLQTARGDVCELPRQLRPGPIEVRGVNVVRALEAAQARADLPHVPAEIAHAPAGGEST